MTLMDQTDRKQAIAASVIARADFASNLSVEFGGAEVRDYIALMKPRVMSLVIFTALVGLMVAPGHLHPLESIIAILCIAIGGGASGALNMWYDGRYRRSDEAHGKAPDSCRSDHAGGGAGLRPDPFFRLGSLCSACWSTGWRAGFWPSPSSFMPSSTPSG